MQSTSSCGVDTPRLLCHNHEVHFVALCTSITDRHPSVSEASSHPTQLCRTTALTPRPLQIPAERVAAAEQAGGAFVLSGANLAGWRAGLADHPTASLAGAGAGQPRHRRRNPMDLPQSTTAPGLKRPRRPRAQQRPCTQGDYGAGGRFLHGPTMSSLYSIDTEMSSRRARRSVASYVSPLRALQNQGKAGRSARRCDLAGNQGRRRDTRRHTPDCQPALAARAVHWARRIVLWPDLEDALQAGQ